MNSVCNLQLTKLLARAAVARCDLAELVQRQHDLAFRSSADYGGLAERDFFEASVARWRKYPDADSEAKALVSRQSSVVLAQMLGYEDSDIAMVSTNRAYVELYASGAALPCTTYFGPAIRLDDGAGVDIEPFIGPSNMSSIHRSFDLLELDCTGASIASTVEAIGRLRILPTALLFLSDSRRPGDPAERIEQLVSAVRTVTKNARTKNGEIAITLDGFQGSEARSLFAFVVFGKDEKRTSPPSQALERQRSAIACMERHVADLRKRAVAPVVSVVPPPSRPVPPPPPPPAMVPATKMMPVRPPPAVPPPPQKRPRETTAPAVEDAPIKINLEKIKEKMLDDKWLDVALLIESEQAGYWRSARFTFTTARIAAFQVLVYARLIGDVDLCVAASRQLFLAKTDESTGGDDDRTKTGGDFIWDDPIDLCKISPATPEKPRIELGFDRLDGNIPPAGAHLKQDDIDLYWAVAKQEHRKGASCWDDGVRQRYDRLCATAQKAKRTKNGGK